jgi:hypothetical protein
MDATFRHTQTHMPYSLAQIHGRVYYYDSGTGQSSWTPPAGSKVTSGDTHEDSDDEDDSHSKHSTKHADSDSDDSSEDDHGPKHAKSGGKKEKRGRHVHKLTHYTARQAAKSLNSFLREYTCICIYRVHMYIRMHVCLLGLTG